MHIRLKTISSAACAAVAIVFSTHGAIAAEPVRTTSGEQVKMAAAVSGFRTFNVEDPVQGATIPLLVFYPSSGKPSHLQFGPFEIDVAKEAPIAGKHLPLVVISHGSQGTPWTLRGLAMSLAQAGFVAVLPEHLGDSRSDSSAYGTLANLQNRPRHIKLAIDAVLRDRFFAAHVRQDAVGAMGLSMGGYSVLAASGGKPWTGPQESKEEPFKPVAVTKDDRIKALILLVPATPWFTPAGSLSDVRIPILMRTGALDTVTPPFHADIVKRDINPELLQHEVVPDAGHFSFMSSFPESMRSAAFPPSQDPPGFDRDAYGRTLADDAVRFLRRALR